jgi:Notch-like protein
MTSEKALTMSRTIHVALLFLVVQAVACDGTFSGTGAFGFQVRDDSGVGCHDDDGDGVCVPDCDNQDPYTFPLAHEYCDDKDNDCDGLVDEGYSVGESCATSEVPGCEEAGEYRCEQGQAVCFPRADEFCNGIDDDCDGLLDESDGSTAEECAASGPGINGHCSQGAVACSSAELVCAPGDPIAETCNALDDDCDGTTDEGVTASCRPDFPSDGLCNPGVYTCTGVEAALWGPCVGYVGPQLEICDLLDNDCDGDTDEGLECNCLEGDSDIGCYSGPEGTLGVGTCLAGTTRACTLIQPMPPVWGWPACNDTPPTIEACDGLDNDCDGTTDEELGLGAACTVGQGACQEAGNIACVGGVPACNAVAGMAAAEACNALDDDCDGRVDETPADACTTGAGLCERAGVEICDPMAGVIVCSAVAGAPLAEICDELDNDCDGLVDEDLDLGEDCTVGEGVCTREGTFLCVANVVTCSATPGSPSVETCDDIDNDCDGDVDEDLGLGNACDGVGLCGAGVRECAPDFTVRCSTEGGGADDESAAEACDALDNDCDGEADEAFALGTYCWGACGEGGFECNDVGGLRCSTNSGGSEHNPVAETCNATDDDCDFAVDEGFGMGSVCGLGVCAGGLTECDGMGGSRCSTGPGGSADLSDPETCNGTDEDCDGSTDEAFDVGDACAGIGECGAGVLECATVATTRCSTHPGGSDDESVTEACSNSLDDDCDGSVDEGC